MPKMHKEILTPEQLKLLPLLRKFSKEFGLVGGNRGESNKLISK